MIAQPITLCIATANRDKGKKLKELISRVKPDVICIDMSVKAPIESAASALGNAILKARNAFQKTRLNSVALDNALFIDGFADNNQPGHRIGRFNKKLIAQDGFGEFWRTNIQNGVIERGRLEKHYVLATEKGETVFSAIIPVESHLYTGVKTEENALNQFMAPVGFSTFNRMTNNERKRYEKIYLEEGINELLVEL